MKTKSNMTDKTIKRIEQITGEKLTLGKLLWAIREADDLSQVEFAEKLKISKQHLCDLEHDRKTVSPKLAAEYARRLGYSKEQFIRLALQDLMDKEGLDVRIEVFSKRAKTQQEKNCAVA